MYWQLFKIWLQSHLVYRVRILIWVVVDGVNFIVFPFLWLAIYGSRTVLSGYTKADIVSYYILSAIISIAFASHIAEHIRHDIIKGDLNKFLVQPIKYLAYRFIHEFSYRVLAFVVAAFLLLLLSPFAAKYLALPKSFLSIILLGPALLISFAISFIIQLLVGFVAFWFGEISSVNELRHMLEKFFSGELAPLVFFPLSLQHVAAFLPFKYLTYFPIQIYLDRLSPQEMATGFAYAGLWIIVLVSIVFIMWKKGLRKYEGAGI